MLELLIEKSKDVSSPSCKQTHIDNEIAIQSDDDDDEGNENSKKQKWEAKRETSSDWINAHTSAKANKRKSVTAFFSSTDIYIVRYVCVYDSHFTFNLLF